MKKLLVLLLSFFLLNSPSVLADDFSDFSIEGVSIGDSLLDYMTEDEILKEIEANKNVRLTYLKEPDKYIQVTVQKDYSIYDYITVYIQNNSSNKYVVDKNEKYTIISMRGYREYSENFDACIQERDEIEEILSSMFSNSKKQESISEYRDDSSGNSIVDYVSLAFDSGASIDIYCENLEETFRNSKNLPEGLGVSLKPLEILSWLRNK